jgi:hypothetical protein
MGGLPGQPGCMKTSISRVARQLSLPVSALAGASLVSGLIGGYLIYLGRSPVREQQVPGTSAWAQHLVVAAVAAAMLGYAWRRHVRRYGAGSGRLWLLAPLGRPAARRAARTMAGALSDWYGPARALLTGLAILVFLYGFYRTGEQVTAGLDPNFTINAWGGPSYLGAMACHYLDGLVLTGVVAWLLDRIMLPDPAASGRRRSDTREQPSVQRG